MNESGENGERRDYLKGTFFKMLDQLETWIEERRRNIFLLAMISSIVVSVVLAFYFSIKVYKHPLFIQPETIPQHIANTPVIVFILTMTIVLLFGIFISLIGTFIPFKRMKIAKMELEFDNQNSKAKISEQFSFVSSVLESYYPIIAELKREGSREILSIAENIMKAFEQFYNEMNSDQSSDVEVEILEHSENLKHSEKKLFKQMKKEKKSVEYWNRFPGKENVMIGMIDISEMIIIVKSPGNFNFYDRETLKSVIMYIPILFYTIAMNDVLEDKRN